MTASALNNLQRSLEHFMDQNKKIKQANSKTIHQDMTAQLHLPPLDLSWALTARQSIHLWQPSSTSLLFISPGLWQQDNPSSYDSPAPPPSSSSPLGSDSKTIHPAMTAQLHLPPLHLPWALTARQSIQLWQPSSTSLLFISPGLCEMRKAVDYAFILISVCFLLLAFMYHLWSGASVFGFTCR